MREFIKDISDELLIGGYYATIVLIAVMLGFAWREREWGTVVACIVMILLVMGIRVGLTIAGHP